MEDLASLSLCVIEESKCQKDKSISHYYVKGICPQKIFVQPEPLLGGREDGEECAERFLTSDLTFKSLMKLSLLPPFHGGQNQTQTNSKTKSQDSNPCLPDFKYHTHFSATKDMIPFTIKERGKKQWSIHNPRAVMSIPARMGCLSLGRLPL